VTETPESCIDIIRDHPEWTASERAEQFDRMIRSFEPDRLRLAVSKRLDDLTGSLGEVLLHLIDALDDPGLFEALAESIENQPGLPADRLWEALNLLHQSGVLDAHPELSERWDELAESLDEEASLDQLVEQIEDDGVGRAPRARGY